MNKKTRKLSKFIEEIREEMQGILMDITDPIIGDEYGKNLRELDADTADIVRTGLVPTWSDLDFNQHVNHVKYINWILESAPDSILETHKLSAMTLEFWKECGMNSCLQSLSALATKDELPHRSTQNYKGVELELDHTIRLENQPQILLKGRTIWLPKTF
nr:palmitoyl-acyl carrier protein thioesterase, chloroplastic-like [Ziziphus jujuba var. spinosa]